MPRRRRSQDAFGRKARQEGFAARSVYKLEEIDRRTRLFKRDQRVLDLGCHPGSWTQYAAERVGPNGHVLGIDLQEHRGPLPRNAEVRQLDIFDLDLEALGGEPFDLVLSDMAPATTGQRHLDQYRSFELVMRAHEVASAVLAPGGALVAKLFQGPEFNEAKQAFRHTFEELRVIRPQATRSESFEVFLVGLRKLEA